MGYNNSFDSANNQTFDNGKGVTVLIGNTFKRDVKNRIIWKESIGKTISYDYHGIIGDMYILDYDSKCAMLHLKTDKVDVFKISTGNLMHCRIGRAIGEIDTSLLYSAGEIINGLEILKAIPSSGDRNDFNRKSYNVKCVKDGYSYNITESSLKRGTGCPICSGRIPLVGANDLETTHPHLKKYITNNTIMQTLMANSHGKVSVTCPDCGFSKDMLITNLSRRGFACDICGDGISIPNKFVRNILKQLNIQFIPEKSFKWSNKKKYDVFIEDSNCIIEAHGIQHYEESTRGRRLIDEQSNDKSKETLAIQNGIINYIILDLRYTQLDYMVDSILKSPLSKIYDMTTVDFDKAFNDSQHSIIKTIAEYRDSFNGEITTTKLCEVFQVGKSTMIRYLKIATQCNMLKPPYDAHKELVKVCSKNGKALSRPVFVYDKNSGELIYEFMSPKECEKELNVSVCVIYFSCKKETWNRSNYDFRYYKVDNLKKTL